MNFTNTIMLTLLIASCAHGPKGTVMNGKNGVNRAFANHSFKDKALDAAILTAHNFCEKNNESAVFLDRGKLDYKGEIPEEYQAQVRKAQILAENLGFGEISQASEVMLQDSKYRAEVLFQCQKKPI